MYCVFAIPSQVSSHYRLSPPLPSPTSPQYGDYQRESGNHHTVVCFCEFVLLNPFTFFTQLPSPSNSYQSVLCIYEWVLSCSLGSSVRTSWLLTSNLQCIKFILYMSYSFLPVLFLLLIPDFFPTQIIIVFQCPQLFYWKNMIFFLKQS